MVSKLAQFTDISAALIVGGLSLQAQVRGRSCRAHAGAAACASSCALSIHASHRRPLA
jgi:hypothetical protein